VFELFKLFVIIWFYFFGLFWESFVRYGFGKIYFTHGRFFGSCLIILFWGLGLKGGWAFVTGPMDHWEEVQQWFEIKMPYSLIIPIYWIVALIHWIVANIKADLRGVGEPLLWYVIPIVPREWILRIIEPVLGIMIGLSVSEVDHHMGALICNAVLASAIMTNWGYSQIRKIEDSQQAGMQTAQEMAATLEERKQNVSKPLSDRVLGNFTRPTDKTLQDHPLYKMINTKK
jgi:hypothetical protein